MDRGANELFLKECGLDRPLELLIDGRAGRERRTFPRPFAVVGRDPASDIVLDHPDVSRRHAYFQAIEGRVFCVDLGSRTGVAWEHGRARSGWLDARAGVRVGPSRILAADDGGVPPAAADPLRVRRLGSTSLPPPELNVFLPDEPGCPSWRLGRALTLVGRSSGCRIRLTDPSVSKSHCSLLRTRDGVWLVDLLGRDGVEYNGRRVRWARLEPGDRLRVGRYAIEVRRETPAAGPSASGASAIAGPRPGRPVSLPSPWPPTSIVVAAPDGDLAPAKAELVGPIMAQMASQFGQMQQQMFDQMGQMQHQLFGQFQQVVLGMAEMFGSLQRDQMALVRDELDRLRQINQDLHALQSRADSGTLATAPPLAAPSPDHTGTILRTSRPGPAADLGPAAAVQGPEHALPASPLRPAGEPAVEPGTADDVPAAPGDPTPATSPDPAGRPPAPIPDDIHALLTRRIAVLQRERQNRWQRVLELMLGR